MFSSLKLTMVLAVGVGGAAVLCPLSGGGLQTAGGQPMQVALQAADTATVRLHISKMTCGSCPATARLALKRLTGVYTATVTLDDSLGVVKYDPRRGPPPENATHLTRLTGFGAPILSDSSKTPGRPGAE